MSKQRRVYELAQEVGLNKQEMVTRINGLGLGMQVNPMSWLSEADVVKIKRALSPGEAHAEEESGSSTKKKGTRKKIEEVAVKPVVAEPEVEIAEPVAVRRRKRVDGKRITILSLARASSWMRHLHRSQRQLL